MTEELTEAHYDKGKLCLPVAVRKNMTDLRKEFPYSADALPYTQRDLLKEVQYISGQPHKELSDIIQVPLHRRQSEVFKFR